MTDGGMDYMDIELALQQFRMPGVKNTGLSLDPETDTFTLTVFREDGSELTDSCAHADLRSMLDRMLETLTAD